MLWTVQVVACSNVRCGWKRSMHVWQSPLHLSFLFFALFSGDPHTVAAVFSTWCLVQRRLVLSKYLLWNIILFLSFFPCWFQFMHGAMEICRSLTDNGFWADFIDPATGKPVSNNQVKDSSFCSAWVKELKKNDYPFQNYFENGTFSLGQVENQEVSSKWNTCHSLQLE